MKRQKVNQNAAGGDKDVVMRSIKRRRYETSGQAGHVLQNQNNKAGGVDVVMTKGGPVKKPGTQGQAQRTTQEQVEEPVVLANTPKGKLIGYTRSIGTFTTDSSDFFDCKEEDVTNVYAVKYYPEFLPIFSVRELEYCVTCDYFTSVQTDIKPRMRVILFNWLVEVHLKFAQREPVLWKTFQLIDRYLCLADINRNKLQLVACACLWIASKYFEIFAPSPDEFVNISDKAFTKAQLKEAEVDVFVALEMEISTPTHFDFLQRYIQVAIQTLKPISYNGGMQRLHKNTLDATYLKKMQTRVKYLSMYTLERCMMERSTLMLRPSLIAAGCIYTALALTSFRWTKEMEMITGCSVADIRDKYNLFRAIKMQVMKFEDNQHGAILRKYQTPNRGMVSLLRRKRGPPAKAP